MSDIEKFLESVEVGKTVTVGEINLDQIERDKEAKEREYEEKIRTQSGVLKKVSDMLAGMHELRNIDLRKARPEIRNPATEAIKNLEQLHSELLKMFDEE